MGEKDKDLTQEGRKPDDTPDPQNPTEQGTGGRAGDAGTDTGATDTTGTTGGDEAVGSGPSGGGDGVPEH